jgi:uncharacterized protein DUF1629
MSEYCLLANSIDENVIGKELFQTRGVPTGYTSDIYDRPNSMTNLNNREFPKENPELLFEMEPTAILTDVVRPGNIEAEGLLCNDKVRDILEIHKLCEHKFYPATLIHEGKELNYHWFHPIEQDVDIIDFEKSEFALTDYFRDFINNIEINSEAKLIKDYNELDDESLITVQKLVLLMDTDILIFEYQIHNKIIISNKLKKSFQINRITGLRFLNIKKSR